MRSARHRSWNREQDFDCSRNRDGDCRASAPDDFMAMLASCERPLDSHSVCVLVAHPDDESLGCGAQLARLRNAILIVLTDGAPRHDDPLQSEDERMRLARMRRNELAQALVAGQFHAELLCLGVRDQTAALSLSSSARRLARMLEERGIDIILTHAYEGGHPDHDACAFLASMAASLIARSPTRRSPLAIVEMPYYRAERDDIARQSFTAAISTSTVEIELQGEARARKARMLQAHASQARMLSEFDWSRERFRLAPAHDFGALPNGGELLYERFGWGMTGAQWLSLVASARRDLESATICV